MYGLERGWGVPLSLSLYYICLLVSGTRFAPETRVSRLAILATSVTIYRRVLAFGNHIGSADSRELVWTYENCCRPRCRGAPHLMAFS